MLIRVPGRLPGTGRCSASLDPGHLIFRAQSYAAEAQLQARKPENSHIRLRPSVPRQCVRFDVRSIYLDRSSGIKSALVSHNRPDEPLSSLFGTQNQVPHGGNFTELGIFMQGNGSGFSLPAVSYVSYTAKLRARIPMIKRKQGSGPAWRLADAGASEERYRRGAVDCFLP
ncbi:hypothetical protein MGYG_05293 [Nannizzia gypsea CBS 118893]|uniref:Uncharacterized protein n=1 Tax=Arthroderma gypseum (strain ATCC MYA-4604 / CBS 118893) TaxID=535722 RepID=E4UVG8_ARTGP|nr:hypothetical protein MGYG_05293 [Nannizzia gypsea CBS 118893]EFR02295.1 hypothetical protein MGYG_05293 [Nannizzia gypsea CBS 118893]